jgi:threonine dehydratase
VHPYNDPRVIAGQGTCSAEFLEQTGGLDMVVAPIGGGGMISGTCLTLSTLAPETKMIAAEPEQADDAYRSFKAGHIIADDAPRPSPMGCWYRLKELTWHFVSNHVSEIYTASEAEIIDAMKLTWKHLRVVMEPVQRRAAGGGPEEPGRRSAASAWASSSPAATSIWTSFPG